MAKTPNLADVWAAIDATEAPTSPHELTDAGNAGRFIERRGVDARYVEAWGWLAWTGTHWERNELKVRAMMMDTALHIYDEAALVSDQQSQSAITKWARQSQQAPRLQAAMWCAQPKLATKAEEFDQNIWLLPAINGTIDLRTGEIHSHRREHLLTRMTPIIFDCDATCPIWTSFLERVIPSKEVREFIWRFVGYSLTGATSEQMLAFIYGLGRNGKSVFREIVALLLGEYHVATRVDSLTTKQSGIPNDIAALAGARLVTVSETPEGVRLNESLVKELTGGDTISARFLRHEFFQFKPQFKLLISGNHKPQIRGTDDGIWRRIALIPFTVQIPPEEVDPTLTERLQGELPGILSWAVRGCREWQKVGLRPPKEVTDAVLNYRSEMDTLGEFIQECCVPGENHKATANELYSAYREWNANAGHQAVSSTRFGLALGERGFTKQKGRIVTWHGIGLKAEAQLLPGNREFYV